MLHEGTLLVEGHVGRRAHHGTGLVAVGEGLGHQRAGIEDEVGALQQSATAHADEVGVAGAGVSLAVQGLLPMGAFLYLTELPWQLIIFLPCLAMYLLYLLIWRRLHGICPTRRAWRSSATWQVACRRSRR